MSPCCAGGASSAPVVTSAFACLTVRIMVAVAVSRVSSTIYFGQSNGSSKTASVSTRRPADRRPGAPRQTGSEPAVAPARLIHLARTALSDRQGRQTHELSALRPGRGAPPDERPHVAPNPNAHGRFKVILMVGSGHHIGVSEETKLR